METKDLIIIGGGPAGLAAAAAARKAGLQDILILERDNRLGGILNQCIHNGFGLHTFKEELTGPEYAQRFIDQAQQLEIPYELNAMVIQLNPDRTLTYVSPEKGLQILKARSIILAMGCRERPRGALNLPGTRPAGIYSAGTAQKFVNLDGWMPGKSVVILGSGDIGLIMARRMTLEGAKVHAVAELLPYSGGLKRNIVQCLNDFNIPLLLSHTVVNIQGQNRVESVTLAKVDGNRRPIPGTEITYPCDTLLLSCGLIPENELSSQAGIDLSRITSGPVVDGDLETSCPGIFACGNVLHVHDLVDFVSEEASLAGEKAAAFVLNEPVEKHPISIQTGGQVRYSVPSRIDPSVLQEDLTVRFRVGGVIRDGFINVLVDGQQKMHRRKRIMAPGEMETVIIKKDWLEPGCRQIRIETQEGK